MKPMTKDQLMEALLLERYGPRPLRPALPPHPVRQQHVDVPADPPADAPALARHRRHLTVLDGGQPHTTAAA